MAKKSFLDDLVPQTSANIQPAASDRAPSMTSMQLPSADQNTNQKPLDITNAVEQSPTPVVGPGGQWGYNTGPAAQNGHVANNKEFGQGLFLDNGLGQKGVNFIRQLLNSGKSQGHTEPIDPKDIPHPTPDNLTTPSGVKGQAQPVAPVPEPQQPDGQQKDWRAPVALLSRLLYGIGKGTNNLNPDLMGANAYTAGAMNQVTTENEKAAEELNKLQQIQEQNKGKLSVAEERALHARGQSDPDESIAKQLWIQGMGQDKATFTKDPAWLASRQGQRMQKEHPDLKDMPQGEFNYYRMTQDSPGLEPYFKRYSGMGGRSNDLNTGVPTPQQATAQKPQGNAIGRLPGFSDGPHKLKDGRTVNVVGGVAYAQ